MLTLLLLALFSQSAAQSPKPAPAPTPAASAPATTAAAATAPAAKESFAAMVKRVREGDLSVDFYQMRVACFESDDCGFDRDAETAMFRALGQKEFAQAITLADKILEDNYIEMDAHYVEVMAHRELGHTEKADFHRDVLKGLVKSFFVHGQGKTKETAMPVIDVHEEYEYLRFAGLYPGQQSLVQDKVHEYDVLVATDPKTQEKVTLYFNIDLPQSRLMKIFGTDKKK